LNILYEFEAILCIFLLFIQIRKKYLLFKRTNYYTKVRPKLAPCVANMAKMKGMLW
jgi:hypothetical protein